MKISLSTMLTAVCLSLLFTGAGGIGLAVPGQAQSFAIQANAGTQGLGGELKLKLLNRLNLRAGGNTFSYGLFYETGSAEDYDIDARADLQSAFGIIDWHPFGNAIRLSTGMVYSTNTFETELLPKQSYTIGGDVLTAEELGQVSTRIHFAPWSPVALLGLGNSFRGSRVGLNIEGGVIFQGAPMVDMQATDFLEPSGEQGPILEENISWFEMYPVFTLSLYYRIR